MVASNFTINLDDLLKEGQSFEDSIKEMDKKCGIVNEEKVGNVTYKGNI